MDSIADVGAVAEDSTLDIAYLYDMKGCKGRKDSLEGFGWLVENSACSILFPLEFLAPICVSFPASNITNSIVFSQAFSSDSYEPFSQLHVF